jgi:hypothetical protein
MPTTIKLKNSVTSAAAPTTLVQGEAAVNVTDKKVWVGNAASSPVQILGAGATIAGTTADFSGVATFSAGTNSAPAITTAGDTNTGIFFPAADTIAFTEGGVESMRIDSSGNLGLGVTPSAWGSQWKALQINTGASIYGSSTFTIVGQNFVGQSSTDNYISNGFALRYYQNNGQHVWQNAPSGTAGNAITFTQAMTLDASGNLGVGTTSPTNKLTVSNAGANGLEVNPVGTNSGTNLLSYNRGAGSWTTLNHYAADHRWYDGVTSTERMRVDSSGNLLVGTTVSPSGSNKIVGKAVTQGNQTSDTNQLYRSSSNGVFSLSPTTQLSQWQSSSAANTFTITLSGRPSGLIIVGVQNNISGSQSAGGVFLAVATDSTTQITTISQTGWVTITPSVSGFAITFTLGSSATGHWSATLLGTAVA